MQEVQILENNPVKFWQCLRCGVKFLMPRETNCQGRKWVKVIGKCPSCGWLKFKFVNEKVPDERIPSWML